MEKEKKFKISFALNTILLILEAIGGYLYLSKRGLEFIQFYTEDSNTLMMFASLCMAVMEYQMLQKKREALPAWLKLFTYISTVGLTLTFLVVIFILIPMMGGIGAVYGFLISGSMLYHHLLCPILAFITFLWFDPFDEITKKETLLCLIPTAVYASVLIVLNLLRVLDGPYPFLRVYSQPVYMSILWMTVILGSAYGIAALLRKLANQIKKS
jgi:hypothetical protein